MNAFRGETVPGTGFHADIYRPTPEVAHLLEGAKPGVSYLIKAYGPKAHGFEPEHASAIVSHMQAFTRIASELGVRVSQPHSYHIEPNGHPGRVNLIEIVEEAGPDLRKLLESPDTLPDHALSLVDMYLAAYSKVWKAGFPISLDPPLANFCYDSDAQSLVYIDTMPPRRKVSEREYISEWPTPPEESREFIENRYFSHQQAQVIYLQIIRLTSRMGIHHGVIKNMIREKLGEEAYAQIDFSEIQRERIMVQPQVTDADAIRILAAEALYESRLHQSIFDEIYKLTHIGNGGIMPNIEDVRKAAGYLRGDKFMGVRRDA